MSTGIRGAIFFARTRARASVGKGPERLTGMTSKTEISPQIPAFRALARHWVDRRLCGDIQGARRALAAFVARLGRSFTAPEREAFFASIEHCLGEHVVRLEQRKTRIDALAQELAAANHTFDERPTIIVARRADRFSFSA
ncbi:hypothetical protein [Sandaracinus amylolyticus]|uniref:hypothetical protein n=1 Tax=Sandaracinus amylolyticus TaxID=927083 RepID=UPI001F351B35|nr:hypothetical protein [Sandaracinus amylolyticus]UJR84410.1 Hypothetical protein I5071_64890 [Sandaracinus amylolyticus]